MVTQTIRVNLNQKDLETIQAVQSDTLREIAFEFYATDAEEAVQLDPDDFTVKFNVLKPDNNFVMTTFTDGVIKLSDQITAVTGTGYYCILLMQDDELIYSGNGKIIINDHVIGTENIDSVSEADGYTFPDDFYTKDTPLAVLDDSTTSTTSTWSSNKINGEINTASTSAIAQLNAMKTGFDGVTYPSPVEMVQGCDTLINTRIKNQNDYIDQFLVRSSNLFQRDKATLHGYYSATGAWVDSSGLNGMWIRIKPNTQYTISGSASYSATFNAEKTWIESYINTSNPYTFTSPNTAEFLYVAVPNVSSYPEKTIVNVGSSASASYSEGYDVPLLANKCLQMGDVTPGSTDFAKTGTNLINKRNFESGYYYSYNYGQKITQASYSTIIFPVKQNFTYTYAGSAAHICFFTSDMQYISGVLAANANAVTFTTPVDVKYISISPNTTNIGVVRLNEGSSDLGYEAFRVEIPDLYTSWIFDYSKFKYPYIRDCKVMCNKATATTTAYYAGVDCGATIDTIESRFIWESGSVSGVVALIIQNNGLDKITDITDLSVHLVLDKDHVKVDILGDRYGTRYYQNIIDKTFATPMALDGETEHKIVFSVDTSTEKVYVYIDDDANMSANGTFIPDSNIASLANVIGPYATFEHFTTVDRDSVAMPMFTKFYCRDTDGIARVYDFFDREDGQLQNTPQGIPYHLISTSHNIG